MAKENEKELARNIASAVNSFSFDNKAFCKAMTQEHRTLQQSFTRMCIAWINHCADLEEWEIDGRNEMSVETCKVLKKALEERGIGNLPLI